MKQLEPTSTKPPLTREHIDFATRGRSWMIVLRGPLRHPIDRFIVRLTGRSLLALQFDIAARRKSLPAVLLTTIGVRTGERRNVVLPYVRDGHALVVMGASIENPKEPQWVQNLRAQPTCWISARLRRREASGRVAAGAERDRLFELVANQRPQLRRYQLKAQERFGRDIPIVVLEPRTGDLH